jgi:hypothetical protein
MKDDLANVNAVTTASVTSQKQAKGSKLVFLFLWQGCSNTTSS